MSQLYSRVFLQILDSSIAEDFTVRHVFEDFLKLADHKTGVVDMTRQSLSRRLNIPLETLNRAIEVLESPDSRSRDQDFEGRRLERLDDHRDWGWEILNWGKYDQIRTNADRATRVSIHRSKIGEPSESFLRFYEQYPKKFARLEAIKAWNKIPNAEALFGDIIRGLLKAKASPDWNRDNGQFIPYPATWLNNRRWEDKPVEKLTPARSRSGNF